MESVIVERKLTGAESLWSELGELQKDSHFDNEMVYRGMQTLIGSLSQRVCVMKQQNN